MRTAYGAASDPGTIRAVNEDRVVAAPPLFFVADGMGGHAAGDVASTLAAETLSALAGTTSRPEEILAALGEANDRILAAVGENAAMEGMGTTVSGVALGTVGGVAHWIIVNVGDSRTYRFDGQHLTQVTVDHSEVEELVAAGQITADEARVHPLRNVVTRSLGTIPAPTPDIWVVPAEADDCYLVCSDGLTNEIDDDGIAEILREAQSPQVAADRLISAAVDAGGRDNVSAVVVCLSVDRDEDGAASDITAPRAVNGGAIGG